MSVRTVSWRDKSFPESLSERPVDDISTPLSEFSTPILVLDGPAMRDNIRTMAAWAERHGLELMPHGKTTMAPELWRRQLDAGATGITVATGWQAIVALHAGVPTVQIANACTDGALLRRISAWLDDHPEQEVASWVDSEATVDLMVSALPPTSRLGVLVERGAPGGRTGARDDDTVIALAEKVTATDRLVLRGVAGYEGALAHDRSPEAVSAVRAFCDALVALVGRVNPMVNGSAWLTAGGSAFFDIVAESFASAGEVRAILRSGAYITHDDGFYQGISPLDASRAKRGGPFLRAAMSAYARVVSLPEPGLALLDAGKRDIPFDEGLPHVRSISRRLGEEGHPLAAEVTALNDQHSFLRWQGEADVRIGDVVRLGLSHPCTAFDKWRLIPVAEGPTVTEAIETFF